MISCFKLKKRVDIFNIQIVTSLLLLCILFVSYISNIQANAIGSVPYGNGLVSVEKKYTDTPGGLENISISTGLLTTIIIRLKYNNTSNQDVNQTYILDTIPNGFTLVENSLKNCYTNQTCKSLNTNLFKAGVLRVAPQAGYFSLPNDNSLLDSDLKAGGYGYIEYKVKTPSYGGVFGTKVYFYGSFSITPVVDPSDFTITTGSNLPCATPKPELGYNFTLGDADYRTDQDFSCQYTAKICVVVFQDNNADSQLNENDSRLAVNNVKLTLKDSTTEIDHLTTSTTLDTCFEPLENMKIYSVEITQPPTPYSTTGGNIQNIGITYASGVRTLQFGYVNSTISLTAEQNVSFASTSVSNLAKEICTTIHDIQVVDTRILDRPGWLVKATIDDFQKTGDISTKIFVSGKLRAEPQTITTVSGDETGLNLGITKTVSSTSDQIQVFSATSSYGIGTHKTDLKICLTIPPFSLMGVYTSKVYFTV